MYGLFISLEHIQFCSKAKVCRALVALVNEHYSFKWTHTNPRAAFLLLYHIHMTTKCNLIISSFSRNKLKLNTLHLNHQSAKVSEITFNMVL